MIEHPAEIALAAALVAALMKALDLSVALVRKRNGCPPVAATQLDVAQAEARIVAELRTVSDTLHGRITAVEVSVARLEGSTQA